MNTPDPSIIERAQHAPWLLWVVAVVIAVKTLADAVPAAQKLLGPIGTRIGRNAEAARRAAVEADDEVDRMKAAELTRLETKVSELEARLDAKDARDVEHRKWDVAAQIALAKAGIEIDPPPAL